MVNKSGDLIVFMIYLAPGLASLAVAAAAWWTAPGRVSLAQVAVWRSAAGRAAAARVARWRWAPAALVALISAGLGLLAYLTHIPDVSASRALDGAAIALAASATALSLYYAMGRLIRRAMAVLAVWLLSLLPLYYYALFALLIVTGWTQCAPGQYECLV